MTPSPTLAPQTLITEADLIESVADALQFISYYHPMDYIRALGEAYKHEQGPAAKDAIAQILTNSRMCAESPPGPAHAYTPRPMRGYNPSGDSMR